MLSAWTNMMDINKLHLEQTCLQGSNWQMPILVVVERLCDFLLPGGYQLSGGKFPNYNPFVLR